MKKLPHKLNALLLPLVVALAATGAPSARAQEAGQPSVEALLEELADPGRSDWQRIEARILRAWSRSGSAAMDLLLTRGREALQAGDSAAAIEHLTALVDHAPDFAEGWNLRASAYYMAGQFGPALEDLGRALTLEPRHFGALAGLGVILEEMGMEARALEAYRAAAAIHPHLEGIAARIARLERRLGGEAI